MLKNKICAFLSAAVVAFSSICANAQTDDDLVLKELVLRNIVSFERTQNAGSVEALENDNKASVEIVDDGKGGYSVVMRAADNLNNNQQLRLVYIIKDENGNFHGCGYSALYYGDTLPENNTVSLKVTNGSYYELTNFTIKAFAIDDFKNIQPISNIAERAVDNNKITLSNMVKTNEYTNSYNPNNNLSYSAKDKKLEIKGKISDDENNSYIWTFLGTDENNAGSEIAATETFCKRGDSSENMGNVSYDENGSYSASIDLSGINDGLYYIYVLRSYNSTDGFDHLFNGATKVYVENNYAYFLYPEDIYENNKKLQESEKDPSFFLTQRYPLEEYADEDLWVHNDNAEIKAAAEEITKNCSTTYDKIQAIHDYVSESVFYDMDYYNELCADPPIPDNEKKYPTTYIKDIDTYHYKYSVCHGYSNLFASMCRNIGIPCKIVTGYALHSGGWTGQDIDGENHAWNEAYDGERWIIVDCTWDSYNIREEETNYLNGISQTYFDMSDIAFSFDHRADSYYNN